MVAICKIDFTLYFISLILGGAGGWIISRWGIRLFLMDRPNERSSHNTVTPKGGGIGILAAFLFCSLYTKISYWFWAPAAGVSVLGLFTDRFEISPQFRLIIQFIAGIIVEEDDKVRKLEGKRLVSSFQYVMCADGSK